MNNEITFRELAGVLATMGAVWVLLPWEPDMSRFEVAAAFVGVTSLGFAVVAVVEMAIDWIRQRIEERRLYDEY